MPKIDVYGIDESDFKCPACMDAKKILNEAGLEFNFIKVLTQDETGFPIYSRETIEALAKRAQFTSLRIRYPIIFIDETLVRIKNLRSHLISLGYDVDPE